MIVPSPRTVELQKLFGKNAVQIQHREGGLFALLLAFCAADHVPAQGTRCRWDLACRSEFQNLSGMLSTLPIMPAPSKLLYSTNDLFCVSFVLYL
jgi:hypothetical protein